MAVSKIPMTTNNSGNNYCKMPDGTLIQWGESAFASGVSEFSILFPIEFVNAAYAVAISPSVQQLTGVAIMYSGQATDRIAFHRDTSKAINYEQWFSWLIIGRWK